MGTSVDGCRRPGVPSPPPNARSAVPSPADAPRRDIARGLRGRDARTESALTYPAPTGTPGQSATVASPDRRSDARHHESRALVRFDGGMRAITPVRFATQKSATPSTAARFTSPGQTAATGSSQWGQRHGSDLLLRGPDGEDVVADLTRPATRAAARQAALLRLAWPVPARGERVSRLRRYAVQVWGSLS
jgi:hypothetical protein